MKFPFWPSRKSRPKSADVAKDRLRQAVKSANPPRQQQAPDTREGAVAAGLKSEADYTDADQALGMKDRLAQRAAAQAGDDEGGFRIFPRLPRPKPPKLPRLPWDWIGFVVVELILAAGGAVPELMATIAAIFIGLKAWIRFSQVVQRRWLRWRARGTLKVRHPAGPSADISPPSGVLAGPKGALDSFRRAPNGLKKWLVRLAILAFLVWFALFVSAAGAILLAILILLIRWLRGRDTQPQPRGPLPVNEAGQLDTEDPVVRRAMGYLQRGELPKSILGAVLAREVDLGGTLEYLLPGVLSFKIDLNQGLFTIKTGILGAIIPGGGLRGRRPVNMDMISQAPQGQGLLGSILNYGWIDIHVMGERAPLFRIFTHDPQACSLALMLAKQARVARKSSAERQARISEIAEAVAEGIRQAKPEPARSPEEPTENREARRTEGGIWIPR